MSRCRYCKRTLISQSRDPDRNQMLSATRDHIIARSRGGVRTVGPPPLCRGLA